MPWSRRITTAVRKLVARVSRPPAPGADASGTADAPTSWVARLQSMSWTDGDLVLTGWAFDPRLDYTGPQPEIRVLVGPEGIEADVRPTPGPEPNLRSNGCETDTDFSPTVFRATLPAASLGASAPGTGLTVTVSVGQGQDRRSGRFTERNEIGAAGFPGAHRVGGRWLVPTWTGPAGLVVDVQPDAPELVDARLEEDAVVLAGDRDIRRVDVLGDGVEAAVRSGRAVLRPSSAKGKPLPPAGRWDERGAGLKGRQPFRVAALASDGAPWRLGPAAEVLLEVAGAALAVEAGPQGQARVVTAPALAVVDGIELIADEQAAAIVLRGRYAGDLDGAQLDVVGRRVTLSAPVVLLAGGHWQSRVDLLVSTWGQPPAPPDTGGYRVRVLASSGEAVRVTWTAAAVAGLPSSRWCPWFRLALEAGPGRTPVVRLNRPLRDDELGTYNQRLLAERYEAGEFGEQDAVYLESFYERMATCNPRALDRVLVRDHPSLPRYWGVRDRSVTVPPGAIPVVDGTEQWWRARAACRWVITNDWLRARFVHQPHQVVLQTWHGTMFKRIGLDLERTQGELVEKFLHEQSLWDLLLSQNPHSTEVFRSAYSWDREFVEEGYPRNDILLADPDGVEAARIRQLLGVPPDRTVILYAPTWRDNTDAFVSFLDVDALAEALGEDYVVLLRAHSRTIRGEAVGVGTGVIDVTTYPDISDLFLVADGIITDYSSIMFDFAVTGRPMVFFVPDLTEYADVLRGVYFDLEPVAPGPVVYTQDEVLAAIRTMRSDVPRYAQRYAEWRRRFVPWDDGSSGERVLARLFATRLRRDT